MKRTMLCASLICCAMLLGGCGTTEPAPNATPDASTSDQSNPSPIRSLLEQAKTLECEFLDEESQKMIARLNGNRIFVQGTTDEAKKMNALMIGDQYYVWNNETKAGVLFDLASAKEDEALTMGSDRIHSSDELVSKLEKDQAECQELPDAPSLTFPSDVTFTSLVATEKQEQEKDQK